MKYTCQKNASCKFWSSVQSFANLNVNWWKQFLFTANWKVFSTPLSCKWRSHISILFNYNSFSKICDQLTIHLCPDTLQLPCLKLFQSENCVSVYHDYPLYWWQNAYLFLPISIGACLNGLESYRYRYWLHTLEAQYVTMKKFSLDMVLILEPHTQPSQPQHERKKSVSYSFRVSTTTPSWTMSLHACSFRSLSVEVYTQLVHFTLPSVHLQCMEGASSKKVLTSNVTAA